ncbi:ATP-binding protein [Oribacterium sp. WCC10]|uniref:ATP-binding protein n=1 Tax=Oribacterium sp. WCC10 TaxID=1855343 RepID=UPI0008E758DE|nr:ATP-binding protein [Oribacterium sp. WCC10]SFG42386.1 tRNA(Ile)-lysidine synthase TilS/MesJ [Oribacterium sp. WCC10]
MEARNIEITVDEFETWPKESYTLIDVRDEEDFLTGKMPDAMRVDTGDIADKNHAIPKDKKVVLYCKYGELSLVAAETLCEQGYEAYSLQGGYGKWVLRQIQRDLDSEQRREDIEKSLRKKFKRNIYSMFVKAICDYNLVEEGDKIAVCISGGKDSMLMAKLFQELKRHNKLPFEVVYLCMDPGYNEANRKIIERNAELMGIPLTIFETNIFDSVYNIPKSPCYVCARMRRGYLYKEAQKLGCNKIALGHHFDDVIETILMGMLYAGQYEAMMPKLHSTNFPGMELIRPLYLVHEAEIKHWRDYNHLNFIQCACHFTATCSTCHTDGQTSSKRLETKHLIEKLKETNPYVERNIFSAMENISLNKILGFKRQHVKHSFLEWYDNENDLKIGILSESEIQQENEKRKAQELQKEKARIESMPKSEQARKNAEENRKNANFRK